MFAYSTGRTDASHQRMAGTRSAAIVLRVWRCGAQQIASSTCGGSRPPNVDRRSLRRGAERVCVRKRERYESTWQRLSSSQAPRAAPGVAQGTGLHFGEPRRYARFFSKVKFQHVFIQNQRLVQTSVRFGVLAAERLAMPSQARRQKRNAGGHASRRRGDRRGPRLGRAAAAVWTAATLRTRRALSGTKPGTRTTQPGSTVRTRREPSFFYRECPGFRGGAASSRARGAPSRSRTGRRRPCPGPRRRSRGRRRRGPAAAAAAAAGGPRC